MSTKNTTADQHEVMLDLKNISLSFGGVKAITDISFDIRKGEVRAIIGPNGAEECFIETEIAFEVARASKISGDIKIVEVNTFPVPAANAS